MFFHFYCKRKKHEQSTNKQGTPPFVTPHHSFIISFIIVCSYKSFFQCNKTWFLRSTTAPSWQFLHPPPLHWRQKTTLLFWKSLRRPGRPRRPTILFTPPPSVVVAILGVCTLGTRCMLGVAEGVVTSSKRSGRDCTWACVASMIPWRSCAA